MPDSLPENPPFPPDPLDKPARDPETEAVAIADDSLIFSLTFLVPTAAALAVLLAYCFAPSSSTFYQYTVQYWSYSGSVVLPIWYLGYTVGWSLPLTVNFLAWHGIFRDPKPLPLPKIDARNVQLTWTHGNLLAWSVPRVLLYVNIILFFISFFTVLLSSELRSNDWGTAVAAFWGAFMLTWTSSQINFYARRRFKLLTRAAAEQHNADVLVASYLHADPAVPKGETTAKATSSEALSAPRPRRPRRLSNVARIPTTDRLQRINEILNPAFTDRVARFTESSLYILTFLLLCSTTNLFIRATSSPSAPGNIHALKDGTHVHIFCKGTGAPTVLLDSGLAGPSAFYAALLERARDAEQVGRYCWWDRPGYAWSSSGVMPQTAQKSAGDWWEVVERAGEQGPFVVVGRGYGGALARLLAAAHPTNVTGVVLIDPLHENQALHGARVLFWTWLMSPIGIDRIFSGWQARDTPEIVVEENKGWSVWNGRVLRAASSEIKHFRSKSIRQLLCTLPSTSAANCPTPHAPFPAAVPLTVVTTATAPAVAAQYRDLAGTLSKGIVAFEHVERPEEYEEVVRRRIAELVEVTKANN